ncbi:PAS domain-containing sensor histidine kinase [Glaciecola sp. SC05]|uniref:sensor histidine kinase n=1 Tax=Glaciecola sp. SC05 TaxID=1987355 RepID=UPI003528F5D1
MSTLSFIAEDSIHRDKTVAYNIVPSIRDVYAKRTSIDVENDALANRKTDQQADSIDPVEKLDEENSPHRFSHLLSIMPAGVVVIDQKGIVSLANKQAGALLEEPLEGELWRDVIKRAFRPQADDGHEVSMRNGKRVKIDISPLTEEKGQLIVITDLTETRQLQHRLGHMQRLSSLGKMVASLAHQVRTPLSSAMLYAENIKSVQTQGSTTERFSQKLILRLKDLESQVNDMLLFAKSGDNHIVKAMSSEDIANVSMQNVEPQFAQSGVKLSLINKDQQAPVLCNLTALSGAISNLLGNALQALAPSSIEEHAVTLEVARQTFDEKDYVVFSVTDTGQGIDEAHLQKMFEPFYTTKSQGTGLGLAVVNTVAKSHNGFVSCANRKDHQGAVFSISVPVIPNIQNEPTQSSTRFDSNIVKPANDANIQGVSA